jgi:hypothetical protein
LKTPWLFTLWRFPHYCWVIYRSTPLPTSRHTHTHAHAHCFLGYCSQHFSTHTRTRTHTHSPTHCSPQNACARGAASCVSAKSGLPGHFPRQQTMGLQGEPPSTSSAQDSSPFLFLFLFVSCFSPCSISLPSFLIIFSLFLLSPLLIFHPVFSDYLQAPFVYDHLANEGVNNQAGEWWLLVSFFSFEEGREEEEEEQQEQQQGREGTEDPPCAFLSRMFSPAFHFTRSAALYKKCLAQISQKFGDGTKVIWSDNGAKVEQVLSCACVVCVV